MNNPNIVPFAFIDSVNCRRVAGVSVYVWRVSAASNSVFLSGGTTGTNGVIEWEWSPSPSLVADPMRLIQVTCPGYAPQSFFVTSLDVMASSVIDGAPPIPREVIMVRPKLRLSIAANRNVTVSNLAPGNPFSLQSSSNLVNWTTVVYVNPTSLLNYTYVPPSGQPRQFFRTTEAAECPVFLESLVSRQSSSDLLTETTVELSTTPRLSYPRNSLPMLPPMLPSKSILEQP